MKSQMRTLLLSVAGFVVLAGSLVCEGQSQRYIVFLKERSGVNAGHRRPRGHHSSRGRRSNWSSTIPPASLAALRRRQVRYVERVADSLGWRDALIGGPADRRPGTASNARFTRTHLGEYILESGRPIPTTERATSSHRQRYLCVRRRPAAKAISTQDAGDVTHTTASAI